MYLVEGTYGRHDHSEVVRIWVITPLTVHLPLPLRGTAFTDPSMCSVFPFAAPFAWDALCLAFPHPPHLSGSSVNVTFSWKCSPHPTPVQLFLVPSRTPYALSGPLEHLLSLPQATLYLWSVGRSSSELLKARDWISPHLCLWAQRETDLVDELPGWRRELENFDSRMKERSQAEEKLWWIELERVPVKKPSREASHPWLDLQGFTWNPLWISPLPSPQVLLPCVSTTCPVCGWIYQWSVPSQNVSNKWENPEFKDKGQDRDVEVGVKG